MEKRTFCSVKFMKAFCITGPDIPAQILTDAPGMNGINMPGIYCIMNNRIDLTGLGIQYIYSLAQAAMGAEPDDSRSTQTYCPYR